MENIPLWCMYRMKNDDPHEESLTVYVGNIIRPYLVISKMLIGQPLVW